jgi:hypothetical protein
MKINTVESNDFKNIILDRLTFEAKKTALRAMMDQKSIQDGFIKGKKAYPSKKLIDELTYLNNEGVAFAHYVAVIPWTPDNTILTLYENRDKMKPRTYSKEKLQEILQRIVDATNTIHKMMQDLHKEKYA